VRQKSRKGKGVMPAGSYRKLARLLKPELLAKTKPNQKTQRRLFELEATHA
jgi:hypothetical protein